jgi:hypothetical protein
VKGKTGSRSKTKQENKSSRQEVMKVVQSRDTQDRRKSKTVVKSKTSAGVTQLVECHLAKVDVESSNLFSRSKGKPSSALLEGLSFYMISPRVMLRHMISE